MDSPDQNAFGMPTDEVTFEKDVLVVKVNAIQGKYEGTLKEGELIGKWSQGPNSLDLNLEKQKSK